MWGRIKLIRAAVSEGQALTVGDVIGIDNRRALAVDSYAWCWALCKFLDSHPTYGPRFRQLTRLVARPDFNERFRRLFREEWTDLNLEWDAYVAELDYGYDFERLAMQHAAARPLEGAAEFELAVDRGWQSTSWLLRAGYEYEVTANGRYTIAHDKQPWPCEPGGVTIRYHAGHPLGMVLSVLRPVEKSRESTGSKSVDFTHPLEVGLGANFTPEQDAILYLRVNDSPAELVENKGSVQVRIRPEVRK